MSEEEISYVKSLPFSTELRPQKTEDKEVSAEDLEKSLILNTKEGWNDYLNIFIKTYNELPELLPLLKPIAPLLFQYRITDRPEMDYWQLMEEDKVTWGPGDYSGNTVSTIIHKTDFETMKKVNSGETNPIEESMAGTYIVEGDMTRLMACAPLAPLNGKTHAIISNKLKKNKKNRGVIK